MERPQKFRNDHSIFRNDHTVKFYFSLKGKKLRKVTLWKEQPCGCSGNFSGRSLTFVVVQSVLRQIIHDIRWWYGYFCFSLKGEKIKKVTLWNERPYGRSRNFIGRSLTFVVVPSILRQIIHDIRWWYGYFCFSLKGKKIKKTHALKVRSFIKILAVSP